MNACCGGRRGRPPPDWTRPTPKPLRRQQRSRDWSEPSAQRKAAPATRCRESSRWPAMENGPHRLKNDLLLLDKIQFGCGRLLAPQPKGILNGITSEKELDMNGLGGLNKSQDGVVTALVQLQLPVVVTKA